jgi:hypothetical protein
VSGVPEIVIVEDVAADANPEASTLNPTIAASVV